MNKQKFKAGDVVKHKTTDFKMVIVSAKEVVNMFKYECRWFNDKCENNQIGYKLDEFEEYELEFYESL